MKIQLPSFIVADLYKHSLVLLDEEPATAAAEASPAEPNAKISYLGDNLQQIVIVVNVPGHFYADDDSLHLLSNVLAALHFTIADAAIINYHSQPLAFNAIQGHLQPQYCLLFGVDTQLVELPFIIPNYQPQQYEGCTVVQVAPIAAMKGEGKGAKDEKRKLWNCLKTIFNK